MSNPAQSIDVNSLEAITTTFILGKVTLYLPRRTTFGEQSDRTAKCAMPRNPQHVPMLASKGR